MNINDITELELLLKISSMKPDTPICHTDDDCYHHYLKLCRRLKEQGFVTISKPFSGAAVCNYKGTSKRIYPAGTGYLYARLTYKGQIEADRIRRDTRNTRIAYAGVGISLLGLLVPALYKFLPEVKEHILLLLERISNF